MTRTSKECRSSPDNWIANPAEPRPAALKHNESVASGVGPCCHIAAECAVMGTRTGTVGGGLADEWLCQYCGRKARDGKYPFETDAEGNVWIYCAPCDGWTEHPAEFAGLNFPERRCA